MNGTVTELFDEDFDEQIMAADVPVLVDFWAEWCGPCKKIAPILEEIAVEEAASLKVAKVDVDEAGKIAQRFEIMSIPTLILFKDGKPVERILGAQSKRALLKALDKYL